MDINITFQARKGKNDSIISDGDKGTVARRMENDKQKDHLVRSENRTTTVLVVR